MVFPKAQNGHNFKERFLDSLGPVKALLLSVFQKLPIQVFMAATDDETEELWNNILTIDETLTQKDTTKKALKMEKKQKKEALA